MFSDGLFVDSNGNSCIAAVLPFAVWILSAREWRHRYVSSEYTAFDWTSRFPLPDEMRLQVGGTTRFYRNIQLQSAVPPSVSR